MQKRYGENCGETHAACGNVCVAQWSPAPFAQGLVLIVVLDADTPVYASVVWESKSELHWEALLILFITLKYFCSWA